MSIAICIVWLISSIGCAILFANSERRRKIILRKAAELKLVNNTLENNLRDHKALIDNLPDLLWMKDCEGRYIVSNAAFARSAGFESSTIMRKTDADIWPVDLAQKYHADDLQVLTQRRPRTIVEQMEVPDSGKRIWVETIKSCVRNADGSVAGTAGIARDITGRKEHEEILNKLNQMFLAIGPSFDRNIQKFVDTCGELLGCDMVIFNKIRGDTAAFAAGWQIPTGFPLDLQSIMFTEMIVASRGKGVQILRNLAASRYAQLFPVIATFRLTTFMGCLLFSSGELIGMLCAVYTSEAEPGENEKRMLEIIAAAISIEEERRVIDEKLKDKMFDLERFNRFAVDRELKMIELKKRLAACGRKP
jgi:PAS domain S-box-containing protein